MLLFRLCTFESDIDGKWRTGRPRLMIMAVVSNSEDADVAGGGDVNATSANMETVEQ